MEVGAFLYDAVFNLLTENEEIVAVVFLLAVVLAVVSAFLTEPILMALLYDKEKVVRYKPLVFFIIDFALLFCAGVTGLVNSDKSLGMFLFTIVVIAAISSAVYHYAPTLLNWLRNYRISKINGTKEEESD